MDTLVKQDHVARHAFFDKWKIIIHNDKDRQDMAAELWEVVNIFYEQGIEEGMERERKEQERTKTASILPLEKKNS